MKNFLYLLLRILVLVIIARYRYIAPGLRIIMYTVLVILLIVFLASQTYLLIQSKRTSKKRPPIVIQNRVLNFFLTVGIPVKNLTEARTAFWVMLIAVIFFGAIYYPPFAAAF